MDKFPTAEPFLPARKTLPTLCKAAEGCKGCPLYKNATHAVFGEGPKNAKIMFIGEQPGDHEDEVGQPLIGPAGKLLDRALEEAKINREEVYVTNAVKHFKWKPRGKFRLHQKPGTQEINACFPWLREEIRVIKPKRIICLGATAARSVFGKNMAVLANREKVMESELGEKIFITTHPSSILRAPGKEARDKAFDELVRDLKFAIKH